jgi:hypothetical protein
MSVINFPSSSAYFSTPQTSWYTGPITWRNIPADISDSYIPALAKKYEYRPDLLSYDLYGSVAYWWIFLARNINVIRDPIWDMVAGMAIYVPTASRIQTLIG